MINHWLSAKNKTNTIREINGMLLKFVGRKIHPIQDIYQDMQKALLKFFKANPDKLKHLTKDVNTLKYAFDVDDQGGYITDISFKIQP